MRKLWVALLVFILAFHFVSATPFKYVISNSQDWRDVYSVELFSNLIGSSPKFLVSARHSSLLVNQLDKAGSKAFVVSSASYPYVFNYASMLNMAGLNATEEVYDNVNLGLAQRLNVTNFILVNDKYGYNAVSAAPYAVVKKSYVIFANKGNIDDVVKFLAGRKVDELILFGIMDREVRDSLSAYNPKIINLGDKFSDDIEMVKLYLQVKPTKQAIFTNGEFLENEVLSGSNPVVFIGRNNVPEVVKDYIKKSPINIGVLIGNELVGTATSLRRTLGISVFVKFAQGSRAPTGPISKVEALDMFYLPRYKVLIDVPYIVYNSATGLIEVTYQNIGDIASYLKGSFTLTGENGEKQVIGDLQPLFLESNALKTVTYKVDPFTSKNINSRAFVIFGDAPKSLEFLFDKTIPVSIVSVVDNAMLNVTKVVYDPKNNQFIVSVENLGDKDAYFTTEIRNLVVGYEKQNVGTKGTEFIKAHTKKDVIIKVNDFLKEDLDKNKKVNLRVYYGERKSSLVHGISGDFEVTVKKSDYTIWVLSAVIAIMLLIFILLKLRVKCDNCGHRNLIFRSHCKKCGAKL